MIKPPKPPKERRIGFGGHTSGNFMFVDDEEDNNKIKNKDDIDELRENIFKQSNDLHDQNKAGLSFAERIFRRLWGLSTALDASNEVIKKQRDQDKRKSKPNN